MTPIAANELDDIVDRVKTWPAPLRISLARQVLETLDGPEISTPAKTLPLTDVFGVLKTDKPPPDDATCDRIVEEERLRKHG